MSSEENIHYEAKEFMHKNVHYESGWYFYDEEQDLYGPFLTRTQTEVALQIYIQQLMDGVSPTQLRDIPDIKKH